MTEKRTGVRRFSKVLWVVHGETSDVANRVVKSEEYSRKGMKQKLSEIENQRKKKWDETWQGGQQP